MHVLVHEVENGEPERRERRQRQQRRQVLQEHLRVDSRQNTNRITLEVNRSTVCFERSAAQLVQWSSQALTLQSSVEARILVSSMP